MSNFELSGRRTVTKILVRAVLLADLDSRHTRRIFDRVHRRGFRPELVGSHREQCPAGHVFSGHRRCRVPSKHGGDHKQPSTHLEQRQISSPPACRSETGASREDYEDTEDSPVDKCRNDRSGEGYESEHDEPERERRVNRSETACRQDSNRLKAEKDAETDPERSPRGVNPSSQTVARAKRLKCRCSLK